MTPSPPCSGSPTSPTVGLRRRRTDERGQTTIELVGVVCVVALIIFVIAANGVGATIAGGIDTGICRITGLMGTGTGTGSDCDGDTGSDGGAGTDGGTGTDVGTDTDGGDDGGTDDDGTDDDGTDDDGTDDSGTDDSGDGGKDDDGKDESVSHVPSQWCETMSESSEIRGDLTLFSIDAGASGTLSLSKRVDDKGKTHWLVTVEGEGRLGGDWMFGREAKLGDLGEGTSGEAKLLGHGVSGTRYEFASEEEARDFMERVRARAAGELLVGAGSSLISSKILGLGWLADGLGVTDAVVDAIAPELDAPEPYDTYFHAGPKGELYLDKSLGPLGLGGLVDGAVVVGGRKQISGEGAPNTTTYFQLSGSAAVRLGLLGKLGGDVGPLGSATVAVTYDASGKPVSAYFETTSGTKGKFGWFGNVSKDKPSFGILQAGEKSIQKVRYSFDLTKGKNLDIVADALHSIHLPILESYGSDSPPGVGTAIDRLHNLVWDGADGATATATEYTTSTGDAGFEFKAGAGLTFGIDGGLNSQETTLESATYYEPGEGWKTWDACGK